MKTLRQNILLTNEYIYIFLMFNPSVHETPNLAPSLQRIMVNRTLFELHGSEIGKATTKDCITFRIWLFKHFLHCLFLYFVYRFIFISFIIQWFWVFFYRNMVLTLPQKSMSSLL